jgi:NAD(P)-dependent dehydrogenase (short-subunit alcohol dehydrogenase family)
MTTQLFDLSGKTALVTGAAGGIGAGIAEVLAEAGATVVIADIDDARAGQQAQALADRGLKAEAVSLDLADEESVVRVCAQVVERLGAPWALVNNAGLQERQLLLEATAAFWDRILGVNLRGAFLMTREIGRAMVAAGQGGRIINITSIAAAGGIVHGHGPYAASKHGLAGLTRASALELVQHKITVNAVLPGGVITPGSMGAGAPLPTGPAARMPPLGLCEARDIGAAVLFLASPAAARVTAQNLSVDAGWSIT